MNHFYEFDKFRVDARERQLWRQEEIIPLTPKIFELLLALIENSGQVLQKDELCKRLWPESRIVDDANLSRNVFVLRKALGDGENGQHYIETVSRRGYRFTAPVQQPSDYPPDYGLELTDNRAREDLSAQGPGLAGEPPPADAEPVTQCVNPLAAVTVEPPRTGALWVHRHRRILLVAAIVLITSGGILAGLSWARRPEPISLSTVTSIAVLPFQSLNMDQSDDDLGMALCDALITRLGNTHTIAVRPTSAVRRFAAEDLDAATIGRLLKVDAVLEGSIQKTDNHIRVTVQLINSADGKHLWADKFDTELTHVLAVEDRVTERLSAVLTRKLAGEVGHPVLNRQQTENSQAYRLYLKGRYYWNRRDAEGFRKGIESFQEAIELDPTYALAYVGLADCYGLQGWQQLKSRDEVYPKARAAARKALEIDDRLAEAHASLALVHFDYEWDYVAAEREFRRALELNANYSTAHHWYGVLLFVMERFDEGLAHLRRAQELDPLSLMISTAEGGLYYHNRRYDEAIAHLQKTLEMDGNFQSALYYLHMSYLRKGMYDQAIEGFRKMVELPRGEIWLASLAHSYARAGRKQEARKIIARMKALDPAVHLAPSNWATVSMALGEKKEAIKWLEKACEEREGWMHYLPLIPEFDGLRGDPQFENLLRRRRSPQPEEGEKGRKGEREKGRRGNLEDRFA